MRVALSRKPMRQSVGGMIVSDFELMRAAPSRWYGVSYRLPHLRATAFYPIPFNMLIRYTRACYYWLASPRRQDLAGRAHAAGFAEGFAAGRKIGVAEGRVELREELWNRLNQRLEEVLS